MTSSIIFGLISNTGIGVDQYLNAKWGYDVPGTSIGGIHGNLWDSEGGNVPG